MMPPNQYMIQPHQNGAPRTLVLASTNNGKLIELKQRLSSLSISCRSIGEWTSAIPEEDGDSFSSNAYIKARFAMECTGLPSLADDSGLCIEDLDGEPGIASARWAQAAGGYPSAFALIKKKLRSVGLSPSKAARAYFTCHLCLAYPDGSRCDVTGEIRGTFVFPPRGMSGFGYDPVFIPEGDTRTFAEMALVEKQRYSHRARALDKLFAEGHIAK